jgi:hypothetical protein
VKTQTAGIDRKMFRCPPNRQNKTQLKFGKVVAHYIDKWSSGNGFTMTNMDKKVFDAIQELQISELSWAIRSLVKPLLVRGSVTPFSKFLAFVRCLLSQNPSIIATPSIIDPVFGHVSLPSLPAICFHAFNAFKYSVKSLLSL